jgi:hypothetical protein
MKKRTPVMKRKSVSTVSRVASVADLPVNHISEESSQGGSRMKLGIFGAILILALSGIFFKMNRDSLVTMRDKTIPAAIGKIAPQMKLKTVRNLKEMNGVYEFELVFDNNGTEQPYTSYITKDGKILFTSGTKLDAKTAAPAAAGQAQQKKLTAADLKKGDGKLTAFVVSMCPYGLQTQRLWVKAMDEQPELSKYLDVKYIGSVTDGKIVSMHGEQEAQENHRQICIREEQSDTYYPYTSCYMKAGKTDECLASTGVDTAKVNACMADATRGVAYAKKDFDLATKLGVSASPTLVLNGSQTVSEFDFGGRVADAIKQLVCGGSKNAPAFCTKALSKDDVAVAFSETTAGTAGAAAAQCATN